MSSRTKTAGEFFAELQRDQAYQARRAAAEAERLRAVESYRAAARDLVAELRALGYRVQTVGDLQALDTEYRAAVPLLLAWLPRATHAGLKEDIVRALSVPWAKEALPLFFVEFLRADDPSGTGLRWAIANGIEVLADDGAFEAVSTLVRDRRYGPARRPLALALAKIKDRRVPALLEELLLDEEVAGQALKALAAIGARVGDRARLAPLLAHEHAWIRNVAARVAANSG